MQNHDAIATSAPQYIDRTQLAELLGISPEFVKRLDRQGNGIPQIRIGKKLIRYDRADVQAWVKSRTGRV